MIPESTQEQATFYVLGLLDAEAVAAFEDELGADADLRELVSELREATSVLAETAGAEGGALPPLEVRERVLARVAEDAGAPAIHRAPAAILERNRPAASPWTSGWFPWALAACLMVCCGVLAMSRAHWLQMFSEAKRQIAVAAIERKTQRAEREASPLREVIFCPLQPVKDSPLPQTAVLWDAGKGQGELHVNHLARPREGEDYQLWVVEEGRKEPVSAGVVKLDEEGNATTPFRPVEDGRALAFAVSIERAGGATRNEGPIVFLGKL